MQHRATWPRTSLLYQATADKVGGWLHFKPRQIAAQHAENVFRCVQSKCATWSVTLYVVQHTQSFSPHSHSAHTVIQHTQSHYADKLLKGILCIHTCLQMVYNIKWHAEYNYTSSAEGFEQRYSTMQCMGCTSMQAACQTCCNDSCDWHMLRTFAHVNSMENKKLLIVPIVCKCNILSCSAAYEEQSASSYATSEVCLK